MQTSGTDEAGFSLIEMVVTVLISGLVLMMILGLMQPFMIKIPIQTTHSRISVIEEALVNYLQQFGRLPCPSSPTAPPSDINFASGSDCLGAAAAGVITTDTGRGGELVRIGAVPARTLNLTTDYMRDGWNNLITYAVTERLTDPSLYNNNNGAIFIEDAGGDSMTSSPGNILYALISHGDDGKGSVSAGGAPSPLPCGTTDLDSENCNGNAVFVTNSRSMGTVYYDDVISYKAFIGDVVLPTCGNKGMIYAPTHPESDVDNCLDPTYLRQGQENISGNYGVNCLSSGGFCDSAWIDMANLVPGDYLIHWSGFLRFDFPQPSQYAVLEFEADGNMQISEKIPFTGAVCQPVGLVQGESGIVDFRVNNNATLRVRMKYYGGANDPTGNGCPGATPRLNMVETGQGAASSMKTISVDLFRKPQTF